LASGKFPWQLAILEVRHNGESDDFRLELADKRGDSFMNLALSQDQISHGYAALRINVAANDVSAPLGMRMACGGMCPKESGMESNRTFIRAVLIASMRSRRRGSNTFVLSALNRRHRYRATQSENMQTLLSDGPAPAVDFHTVCTHLLLCICF
jgi:hypothetical protein